MTAFVAQNGTEYEVWLSTKDGTRLAILDDFIALQYSKVANDIGSFAISLPDTFDMTLAAKDRLLSVWRKPVGGAQGLDFRGPVLQIFEREEANGSAQIMLYGASLTHFLKRRTIAYAAQTAYTDKTDNVDDMMKALVRENMGSLATDAERNMANDGLSVQIDLGLGPSETRSFSWKNILTTLRDLSDISRTDGTEIFFSIEPTSETTYEFRTYATQPGRDLRDRLFFSRENGNLGAAQYDQDWKEYGNFVYALGTGDGLSREVIPAYLDTNEPSGVYRTEVTRDARNDGFTAMVISAAAAKVQEVRPIKHFEGEALSVPGSIYGLDWQFGDYVSASFRGRQFDCIIRAVSVTVDSKGKETISAALEAYA